MKDFIEDFKRKKSDDEENNKLVLYFNKKTEDFEEIRWEQLKLGDVIKIKKDEYFPADLVIINTSGKEGECFIETKNLDGETNLKFKQANYLIKESFPSEYFLNKISGKLSLNEPNQNIYEFDGIIQLNDDQNISFDDSKKIFRKENTHNSINTDFGNIYNKNIIDESLNKLEDGKNKDIGKNKIYLDKRNFLLRGCSLRNADFIYGICVYLGHFTKIMMNSKNARYKTSKLENNMNSQIFIILLLQFILSITSSVYNHIWISINSKNMDYILNYGDAFSIFKIIFGTGTWILIFTNLVPISLLVSMEMIKFIQGIFISWDYELYDDKNNISAKCQTSTLNEELGQVKVNK